MSLRYKRLGDAEIELGAFRKRIVVEDNSRLLTFDRPPREKRKAEIKAMARIKPSESGDQFLLPMKHTRKVSAPVERSEKELQKNLFDWLRLNNVCAFHPANETTGIDRKNEKFHAIQKHRWQMGVEPGVFDIIIISGGRVYAADVKDPIRGGDTSEAQDRWQAVFEAAGGTAFVGNDWYKFMAFFKQHGIGRQR